MDRYNGWTNQATHDVHSWLCDDEEYREATLEIIKLNRPETRLRDYVTQDVRPFVPGMYADLINVALSQVNWAEIVASFRGE